MSARKQTLRRGDSRRRGVVAVLVATGLVVLLGFLALTVDVGYMYVAVAEMQRTADASALAGAAGLAEESALELADDYGTRNWVVNQQVVSSELDIEIGNWDGVNLSFSPAGDDSITPNAVRVRGTRTEIELFFAGVLGHEFTSVRRSAVALAGAGRCAGIWGLEGMRIDGNVTTDSYDSTDGPYGPGNMRQNGDLCSCRDIVTHGGVDIRGDAMYGEGYSFDPHGSSYEVSGTVASYGCGTPDIDVNYAWAAQNNDNDSIPLTFQERDPYRHGHGSLYVGGSDHLTLPPGTYYFTSMTLSGQAYLEITGPTTIYIDGNATLTGGGVLNLTEDPRNLTIYARGPNLKLGGGSSFHGSLIAPTATVELMGDFEYYGTLLARFVRAYGSPVFHVEESLVFDLFGINVSIPVLVK